MFTWMDDPNSTIDFSKASFALDPQNHDVIQYKHILATNTNASGPPEADVGVWLPYVWVRNPGGIGVPGQPISEQALTWNNQLHGWYTPNFIAENGVPTNESLLVTAKFITAPERPDTELLAGSVADLSGTHPFGAPPAGGGVFEREHIQSTDLLPFTDIGPLAAGKSTSFEVDFTYHWGGTDLGAMRVGQAEHTLVPDNSTG
jgi:hypothetical protein